MFFDFRIGSHMEPHRTQTAIDIIRFSSFSREIHGPISTAAAGARSKKRHETTVETPW